MSKKRINKIIKSLPDFSKPKPAKLTPGTKAFYRRQSALKGWETRRVHQALDRITKQLKAQFDISPYTTREIIAKALQKPPVRNSWNNNTKPHKNTTINKRNLEKNQLSREFLAKEAKAAKPKSPSFYIRQAFEEAKRQASPLGLKKLEKINIKTKEGKREYARLFANNTIEEENELYDELQQASKAYRELDKKERDRINWTDAYNRSLNKKAGEETDWEQYFADQLKAAAEGEGK